MISLPFYPGFIRRISYDVALPIITVPVLVAVVSFRFSGEISPVGNPVCSARTNTTSNNNSI